MTTSTFHKPNLVLEGPSEDLTPGKAIKLHRLDNFSVTNLSSNSFKAHFSAFQTPQTTSIPSSQAPTETLPGQALLDRVETALKRSRSINPGIRIKDKHDVPNYSLLNIQTPSQLRPGAIANIKSKEYFTPSRGGSDLLMSAKSASNRDPRDIWMDNKAEKISAIKQEGETIQKIYENLFQADRTRRSPSEDHQSVRPVNLSHQPYTTTPTETLNKSAMPLRESRSLTRDSGFKEINALKSGINNIEGQLNALESLNNSGHLSRASSVGIIPSAPRSQSCNTRKNNVFEREDDYSLAATKKERVSFFEHNMKESMLCRTIPNSNYTSKEPSILLDHTVKNIDTVIHKPIFESSSPSKSSLQPYSAHSTNASRNTLNGNAPVRALYDSTFIPNRESQTPMTRPTTSIFQDTPASSYISFEKEIRSPSPLISPIDISHNHQKLTRPSRSESIEKHYLEEPSSHTPQGEHSLYTTKLTAFLNMGSVTGHKRYASHGSTPSRDQKISERSQRGQEEGENKPYLDFINGPAELVDRALNQDATPTDRKMKKLILRSRSIEEKEKEIEKKDVALPLSKPNVYPKPQGDTMQKGSRILSQESEKANSNGRLPSQVTFRPTGFGSSNSNIHTKGSIKEIADDGKAWNMKQLPGSIFEDPEQSFDFDTPAPKKVLPVQVREKIAARLPHSRSISSLQNGGRSKALVWTLNSPDTYITDMRRTLVATGSRPLGKSERRPIFREAHKVERPIL